MRRRTLAAGAVGIAAVASAVALVARTGAQPVAAADDAPATAEVAREDLVVTTRLDGTLVRSSQRTLEARVGGTLTSVAPEGATVAAGQALYAVDGRPVLLLPGNVPAHRDLRVGDEGADVRQLEEALRALGRTGFSVDDRFTAGTANAVRALQEGAGLPETGVLELGSVVFAPAPVVVVEHVAEVGRTLGPGAEVLRLAGTERVVHVDLELDDRRLVAEGAAVQVALGDGRRLAGSIRRVGSVATTSGSDGDPGEDSTSTVDVEVTLVGDAAGEPDGAPVQVEVESARADDVLTVPVLALLALAEGGYGVEVVDGAGTRVVPVQPGLFAHGKVQVDGDLAEGDRVVVAAS